MGITKRAGRKAAGQPAKEQPAKRGGVKKAVFETSKKKEVGVSDLTLLSKVSNEAINDNLKKRFENGQIYTYIGHVLISVNPFRDLGIYTPEVLNSYKGKNRLEVPPHVFAVAESMYYNMKAYNENQCVIISGESGAGKTEAAKRIMQYIASASGESSSSIEKVKDMVLATNPLLESFGCAKTLRNDNSSRHGKYLEILFNAQGEPVGANITNYLLEKGRVVGQIRNERNFHIFYQYTKGAPQQYREQFGVQPPESYTYTSASKCTTVDSIDDLKDFSETLRAMSVIGLSQAEQDEIFRLLAAVLWIGNLDFVENDDGTSSIRDPSVTRFVAYLLAVDEASLEKAMTVRVVETSRGGRRGSVYESPLNPVQARAVRDALAMAVYNNMFDWIVERVNKSLQTQGVADKRIGILDIYGFEIFEHNSFEQICINYVNEKLQQIFIQLTLKTEQEEYAREQIEWTPIKYFDNKVVCDLIEERRPPGIFSVLNDAVATAHADSGAADQNFAMKLSMLSSNPNLELRQNKFLIKHYAGDVMYDVTGMTDKNKDQLLKDLLNLVNSSSNTFLHSLFPEPVDNDSRRRPPTASDKIKQSANDLMKTLSMAQPSYIRTIKPNQNKSPTEYDEKAVLHQVKYLGLQENVRIRRAGFAYRQTFEKFVERFYLLSGKTSYAGDYIWQGDHRTATVQIFRDTGIPAGEYQLGTTKAFIKTPETLFALEHMRDMYWHNMAARIQRAWRAYLRRKAEAATKIQRAWREYKGSQKYVEVRERGHRILGGRKQRRRFSLLGYRRFNGDYLTCNDKTSSGGYICKSVGIAERVKFSARGEALQAKFGRSSMRVPRVFILTASKFYIVLEQVVQRQVSYTIERSIPVSSIRQISMSNLRDDWFALNTSSTSEPDPFLWCVLKTELATLLNVSVKIDSSITYNKKPGKPHTVKFQLDPNVPRDDTYKSGVVHVPQGMPANSVSEPVPPRKPRPASSRPASRPAKKPVAPAAASARRAPPAAPGAGTPAAAPAAARPPPTHDEPRKPVGGAMANVAAVAAANASYGSSIASRSTDSHHSTGATSVSTQQSHTAQPAAVQPAAAHQPAAHSAAKTAPPPPPPAPPAQATPKEPTARALYDYATTNSNELGITKGEVVVIVQKMDQGWWLARRLDGSAEGWTPAAYVEEIKQPAAAPAKKAPPPAPPKKSKPTPTSSGTETPVQGGTAAPASIGSGLAAALKQQQAQNSTLAGGLANALKARSGRRDSDDEAEDDDW